MQSEYIPFEIESSWQQVLKEELKKPYLLNLAAFVQRERTGSTIYPPKELVFNAFKMTPYNQVKVVIVGQDPYHRPGQAHGLSFSVPKGIPMPPSLQNIFKELASDLGIPVPSHGCLINWTQQGVLLLNALLTVKEGEPMSHQSKGWEQFTNAVIASLAERNDPVAFVLWGKAAQEKCSHIPGMHHSRHLVLTAAHPSPYSAHQGFFGCKHFSKINQWLTAQGKSPINWNITEGHLP